MVYKPSVEPVILLPASSQEVKTEHIEVQLNDTNQSRSANDVYVRQISNLADRERILMQENAELRVENQKLVRQLASCEEQMV